MIPSLRASGKFIALAPFDKVVDPDVFYTVEAIRTIPEMQALKLDLFKLVWEPVGSTEPDYQTSVQTAISQNAAIISLTSRGRGPVYLPSTFIKSFPLVDGVVYDHLALIVDLGACPPSMKGKVQNAIDHINNYVKMSFGIKDPTTTIGVVPTRGYVSKETANAWEKSRLLQIQEEPSDAVRLNTLQVENSQLKIYIQELEALVKAGVKPDGDLFEIPIIPGN